MFATGLTAAAVAVVVVDSKTTHRPASDVEQRGGRLRCWLRLQMVPGGVNPLTRAGVWHAASSAASSAAPLFIGETHAFRSKMIQTPLPCGGPPEGSLQFLTHTILQYLCEVPEYPFAV